MRDAVTWLEDLGLGQYAEAFVENDVDLRALPHLTDPDLRELGVSLGHRRILLAAIAELGNGARPDPLTTTEGRPETADAERRQLTVMFCDVVGSTALSARLDPEDLRDVLRAFQELCAERVGRFEGHIAKYLGDGLLVYFGYPQAHEDDPRRAVNAGVGIVGGMQALNRRLGAQFGIALGVRVGIHTGLVVAGEMGSGVTREADAIVGETPNIAARLEGLADPDTVVISAATQRLVEGLFDCDDLGPHTLRGVSEPVVVFRVRGESDTPSAFEAAAKRGLSPLVGREAEVDLLLSRWASAKNGEGQAVLLSGEPGIGKSRVMRVVQEQLAVEGHNRILYHCSPFHQNSALYPVVKQSERALRFDASDGPGARLDKLESALAALALTDREVGSLLATLLSLPTEGRYPKIEASPQLLRRRTLEALLSLLEAMAAVRPVLFIVEDAHWADPSTLEFLGLVIGRLQAARVLLLISSRPGFEPSWGAHLTALRLNRLSRRESTLLVTRVAGGRTLPEAVCEQIVERADGVPLFVEELTKTVLESDLPTNTDGRTALDGPTPPVAIPTSLRDSLMARLDRLAPVKSTAQLAATIGRSFRYDLLTAVSPKQGGALDNALRQLEAAELIYRRGTPPNVTYDFKHALVQDAAYESLLKRDREAHHARIAQALVRDFPALAEDEPELLAHHYTEAGLAADAVDNWQRAGRRAMQRSANVEAERHLRKGLTVLGTMPEGAERRRREIALQNTLGVCMMPTRGFGNPDVAEAFSSAAAIAEAEGDVRGLFVALRGKGQYQMISGDLRTARQQAERILGLADQLDDPGIHIEAHHLGWSALTFTGDFAGARRHAEAGIALYDQERDHRLTHMYSGHDPGMCCRSFGALALWQLGYPDQALATCQDGERLARAVSHPFSQTIAFWATGMLHLLRREPAAVRETGEAMVAHCQDKGFPPFVPMGRLFRGGAIAEAGGLTEGIAELAEGIAGVRRSGTEYTLPLFLAWLAELCCQGGRLDEGWTALSEGLSLCEKTAERFSLPEFHRVKGALLLAQSAAEKDTAAACFERAIEIARGQGARSLELRAATNLAHLWADEGRRAEAQELLAPRYAGFTEGLDLPDLVDAKRLLDALR